MFLPLPAVLLLLVATLATWVVYDSGSLEACANLRRRVVAFSECERVRLLVKTQPTFMETL